MGVFIGSVESDKYHYPSCRHAKKITDANAIWFSSAEDAQAHGYSACKVCHPPS
ncbi:Ada metal-binding domain-containing protein [Intestinimonas massiliensis (ex Afouda et al. 2020)]|uniref:Ada metal-binding domain-containing protein n=1 Tax=Intestinimonas massiliensis (ex Afouda et al. 2020) TaxID=1673721 RepID=UPI0013EEF8C7|nr:Ada metal-binding domain-containing protein [Intestinimonas massiliensis (ex Afouda et al. 2020)]